MLNKDQTDLLFWLTKIIIGDVEIVLIERTAIDGFVVSTVLTPDMGHETAIDDKHDIYVVERYQTEKDAKKGHARWVSRLQNGWRKVFRLPYKTLTPEEVVVLQPKE